MYLNCSVPAKGEDQNFLWVAFSCLYWFPNELTEMRLGNGYFNIKFHILGNLLYTAKLFCLTFFLCFSLSISFDAYAIFLKTVCLLKPSKDALFSLQRAGCHDYGEW